MKIATKQIIACSTLALLSFTTIEAQNIAPLQKYTTDNLYSSDAEFQVSGNWKGTEVQFDRTKTYIEDRFDYELNLTQEGNRITGTSLITDGQGNYGKMELRGFVVGSKLYFEEYLINDQLMKRPNTVWCLTTGELLIVQKDNKLYLSGTLDGYASQPFSCNQTYVAMQSNNKQETTSLTPTAQNALVSTFIDSKQQMDAFPNPFREDVTITYSPDITGEVTLDILDITGKKIATLIDAQTPATSNQVKFKPSPEASNTGIYFAVLKANGKIYSRQLLQVK